MSLAPITDVSPVLLTCRITADNVLDVLYEGQSLLGNELLVELDKVSSTLAATSDFQQNGESYKAHAFTIETNGDLSAWAREGSSVYSETYTPGTEEIIVDAVIDAVSYLEEGVVPARMTAVYKAKTQQVRIRIKVRRKGSKPNP